MNTLYEFEYFIDTNKDLRSTEEIRNSIRNIIINNPQYSMWDISYTRMKMNVTEEEWHNEVIIRVCVLGNYKPLQL